jgi:hypothetical protein
MSNKMGTQEKLSTFEGDIKTMCTKTKAICILGLKTANISWLHLTR